MARFTATFTVTEATDWIAGSRVRETKFKEQLGQNIEWLAQSHDHSGDVGDGGTLAIANPLYIWLLTPPLGSPFA